jgi:diphosphate--fructose-6-phosphate 1-phosphotransferase
VDLIQAKFPTLFGQRSVDFVAKVDGDEETEVHFSHKSRDLVPPAHVEGPLRVGVVLSGGQAPGGHNVIAGLYDWVVKEQGGTLFGFKNGPIGVMNGDVVELDDATIDFYRNMGGFDMIGSGRDKIHSPQQFAASLKHCEALQLNGVVVIGGDDSNTNACLLAEYFKANATPGGLRCAVLGCPKTIDNDMKNEYVPVSFGFDTACMVYSEQIGSVALDALAEKRTYHWVRVMGRSASHIGLECTLQTQPNFSFVGEEVRANTLTLQDLAKDVADIIVARFAHGKAYGVGIIPEGLIEFIPEVGALIAEISDVVADGDFDAARLSTASRKVFEYLPTKFAEQLLLDRDSHGNVNVSGIETEKLLSQCVAQELAARGAAGDLGAHAAAASYDAAFHFFGYEGRSALPSQFDCDYCYALGFNAGLLCSRGFTGMISSVGDLDKPVAEWSCGGMPHTNMMNVERRSGGDKCVIKKALTELDGLPFLTWKAQREEWARSDAYRAPGPMQFSGPTASNCSITLQLEYEQKRGVAAASPKRDLASLRVADPTPLASLPEANDFGGLRPSGDIMPIAVLVAGVRSFARAAQSRAVLLCGAVPVPRAVSPLTRSAPCHAPSVLSPPPRHRARCLASTTCSARSKRITGAR